MPTTQVEVTVFLNRARYPTCNVSHAAPRWIGSFLILKFRGWHDPSDAYLL